MKLPLEITFRGVDRSEDLESRIRDKAAKLDRFCDNITGCRVVVEAPHNRHTKGNLFHVRIDLSVPGNEIVVNREPHQHRDHEDVWIAVRDAFNAAQRQLQSYSRKRQATGSHRAVSDAML
jgi:ribosomal subunit interface protein